MYAREVEGQTLTFAVSGLLWQSSLIMRDKETGSLWSHILGECKQGPLQGKTLVQLPSVMTTWQAWREQHPDGTVMAIPRTANEYRREFYRRRDQFVLGIASGEKPKAWGFDLLTKQPVLADELEGLPVVVFFDRASVTPRLYKRELDGELLSFRWTKQGVYDNETGSAWNPVTGRAMAGPLKGKSLAALPAIVSFRQVWERFHPRSEILTLKRHSMPR